MRLSAQAWAAAAAAGVGLIARGRLLPTVGADGTDIWRAGPLDPADLGWIRQLAAAFPPTAHPLALPGSRPMRLRSPESLIRDLWDAIADLIVRSPAAPRATASPAFAAAEPLPVGDLADWLADTTDGLAAGARLGLRIEAVPPPAMDADDITGEEDEAGADGSEPAFRLVLQLRSNADPSLIVDAAALWSQPETVLSRFGAQAETDLLLALRRGAPVWPPLAEALRQASPSVIDLDDDALTSLLGPAAEELAGAGIEVLWPSSMLGDGLELRAVATPAPEKLTDAGFGLAALLDFRWQLTLGGALLDADEIAALAEAKRPLIRLRGRWVILDPALLDRLRRPPRTRMRTSEALGAVLAGSAEIDGEMVTVVAEGPLADLAARVAGMGSAPAQVEPPPGLTAALRPYQQRGLAWLAGMCETGLGGCLADDMGLGKTIQVIALHLHRREAKAGPTLVVCPASLLGTWEREVRRFAPDDPGPPVPRRRTAPGGPGRRRDRPGHLRRGAARLGAARRGRLGPGRRRRGPARQEPAVADGPGAAGAARAGQDRADRHAGGEPAVGPVGDPRLDHAGAAGAPGGVHQPGGGAGRAVPRRRGHRQVRRPGPAVPAAAQEDRPGHRARTAAQDRDRPVRAADRPSRSRCTRRSSGRRWRRSPRSEGIERAGLVFKLLTALKQICNHPAQYLRQAGPLAGRSGKLAAFDELADLILAGGESMLVFTQYMQMGTLLQRHLDARGIGSLFLHGGVPVPRREEMVARFQAGEVPVFLLSLKAGGTGLTLTRATHVLHYDRWWNPAVEDQATDRAYRIGQDRPVQVHRLVAEGTLEDRIAALLETKRELADAVIGSGEGWIAELSDAELAELVSLRAAS